MFFPRLKEESQINILIITIAKVAIFKAKYQEHAPNLQHFLSLVKIEAQKEKECAILSKQKEKSAQKWVNIAKISDGYTNSTT